MKVRNEMEQQLKKCPFCGSSQVQVSYNVSRFEKYFYFVGCRSCGARTRGESISAAERKDEWNNLAATRSIKCWNQRVGEENA